MISVLRRLWIPIVMVVVASVGAAIVLRLHGVFGSHQHLPAAGNADAIIAFNPKLVVYEVSGPAGTIATINYLDADAQPHEVVGATIPWTQTIVTTLSVVVANVVARSNGDALGCRITVNDVVRAERTVDAHNTHISCLVKSA